MKISFKSQCGIALLSLAMLASCAPNNQNASDALAGNIVGGRKMSLKDQKKAGVVGIVISTADGMGICTGSLIAKNIVLTAAHCLDESESPIKNIFVVFAENVESAKPEQIRIASTGVAHEGFAPSAPDSGKSWNDIALLKLSEDAPADFKLALLPEADLKLNVGQRLIQSGYGRAEADRAATTDSSGVLRTVTGIGLLAISLDGLELQMDEAKKGSCNGDSGGPAYLKTSKGQVIVGVDSRGTLQTSCIGVGIYTNVVAQLPWIKENMQSLQAQPSAAPVPALAQNAPAAPAPAVTP
jgi:secreted trypsin-like serine protease